MITVYSKANCSACEATKAMLDKHNVEYDVKDIMLDPEALDKVIELGFSQAPVVVTEDDAWSGYEPTKIAKHVMSR